jgi:hypothetical protein
MKIIEKVNDVLKIEVPKSLADQKLKYYDKKSNTHKQCDWLDTPTNPFYNKHHCMLFSGSAGSDKTSSMISLISSMKYRCYSGLYDKIMICAPATTMKSLKVNPFEDLPSNQQFESFDDNCLDSVLEMAEISSLQNEDCIFIVDDAASALKGSGSIVKKISNLIMRHRHLKLSIWILCQDLIQLPLQIRENLNIIIVYRPVNSKRSKLFHEEFLSDFNIC